MTAGRLAGAAAAAVLALAAPAWSCGPPGSMDDNGGQTGQGAGGDASGQRQNGNNNSDSNGGDRAGSWNRNGAAEGERQGASDQASRDLDGGDAGGPRRNPSDGGSQGGADYSNQIGAVGQAQATGDEIDCRALRAELDQLTSNDGSDLENGYSATNVYLTRVMQMTPAMLDQEIASERSWLDNEQRIDQNSRDFEASRTGKPASIAPKQTSPKLNFLLDLRASQLSGLGQDGMQRRAQSAIASVRSDADAAKAARRQQITDLRNRISNLGCDTYAPAADQSVPPGASPSPEPQ